MQTQTTSFQALENVIKAVKLANKSGLFELEQSHLLAESLQIISNLVIKSEQAQVHQLPVEDKEPKTNK